MNSNDDIVQGYIYSQIALVNKSKMRIRAKIISPNEIWPS